MISTITNIPNAKTAVKDSSKKSKLASAIKIIRIPKTSLRRLISYFSLSSFEAVLYPAISMSPFPLRITIPKIVISGAMMIVVSISCYLFL